MKIFVSVSDLERTVESVVPLRGGEAWMLPVPVTQTMPLQVVLAAFRQPARKGRQMYFPPHWLVTLRATDGGRLGDRWVRPSDLGIAADPKTPIHGFGLDHVPSGEFHAARDRIARISPEVWVLFQEKKPASDPLVKEYVSLYERCVYVGLRPYHRAMAPAFFAWLGRR